MSKGKVVGSVYNSTTEGFNKLLREANQVSEEGYELLAVVPLENRLVGAVFRREVHKGDFVPSSFFEE